MDKPTCQTCAYYDPEASVRVYGDNPWAGMTSSSMTLQARYEKGACKRHAETAGWHKSPNDFCGDHHLFPEYLDSLKRKDNEWQAVLSTIDNDSSS